MTIPDLSPLVPLVPLAVAIIAGAIATLHVEHSARVGALTRAHDERLKEIRSNLAEILMPGKDDDATIGRFSAAVCKLELLLKQGGKRGEHEELWRKVLSLIDKPKTDVIDKLKEGILDQAATVQEAEERGLRQALKPLIRKYWIILLVLLLIFICYRLW